MTDKKYTDMLGNELKPKFGVGGFKNDITYVALYKKVNISIFGLFKKDILKKVFFHVTCDDLKDVAHWTDSDYSALVWDAIREYNTKVASREAVYEKMKDLNS